MELGELIRVWASCVCRSAKTNQPVHRRRVAPVLGARVVVPRAHGVVEHGVCEAPGYREDLVAHDHALPAVLEDALALHATRLIQVSVAGIGTVWRNLVGPDERTRAGIPVGPRR